MKLCEMKYNYDADRWGIFDSDRWEWITDGLHCGECFTILTRGAKVDVRIEFSDDWYLVGASHKGWEMDGLCVIVE